MTWTLAIVIAGALVSAGALYTWVRWRNAPQAYRAIVGVALCYFVAGLLLAAWALQPTPSGSVEAVTPVRADSVMVMVPGTAGPWNPGTNPQCDYGAHDQTPATVLSARNGLSFEAGTQFTVAYVSGEINIAPEFGAPSNDPDGRDDAASPGNDQVGSFNKFFPSKCIPAESYPVPPGTLVGAFTDGAGRIVATPFKIGNGPTVLTVPNRAVNLQLGVNDTQYSNNVGAWRIKVVATQSQQAP